jgi:hypothetical protein
MQNNSWIDARIFFLEEFSDEFDEVLYALSGSNITYRPLVYLMTFDIDDSVIWTLNAFYRDTRIQLNAPLSDRIIDSDLTEIVDRVEFMTGGSVAKVVVGFLEVRDEETYTKLASALAESSVLLGNTLLERH